MVTLKQSDRLPMLLLLYECHKDALKDARSFRRNFKREGPKREQNGIRNLVLKELGYLSAGVAL